MDVRPNVIGTVLLVALVAFRSPTKTSGWRNENFAFKQAGLAGKRKKGRSGIYWRKNDNKQPDPHRAPSTSPFPYPVIMQAGWIGKPTDPTGEPVTNPMDAPWTSFTFDDLNQMEQAWLVMWRDSWGMPVHLWDRSAVTHVEDETQTALALISIDPTTLAMQFNMSVEDIKLAVIGVQVFTSEHPILNEADRYLLAKIEEAAAWVQPGSKYESWFPSWWPFT